MKSVGDELSALAYHETGIVWGVRFPWPNEEFMSDFQWDVTADSLRRLNFSAYAIRKLKNDDGTYSLNIRFFDRASVPHRKREKITVTLTHPSA